MINTTAVGKCITDIQENANPDGAYCIEIEVRQYITSFKTLMVYFDEKLYGRIKNLRILGSQAS